MREEGRNINISGISVLMVFLIMSISIFAVLTLSTAQSEWNLSKKNEQQVEAYYTSDGLAQIQLSELYTLIKGKSDYNEIKKILSDTDFNLTLQNDRPIIDFKTTPYHNRQIEVHVAVNKDASLEVLKYRLINTQEYDYDKDPDVYKPGK